MTGIYRLAEKEIEIQSLHAAVHEYCRDYRSEGPPDFTVEIRPEDIEREREKSEQEDLAEGRRVRRFAEDYLEELAVYRKIAERMPRYDTLLLHGSCIALDGAGYLFTAKSGTGKSTHTRLWRERFGARAVMVNDDKPLLRVGPDSVTVFGTPWDGKHRLSRNIAVPLRAICLLERAAENRIAPLTGSEAWPRLLQQVYRPADPEAMTRTLKLLDRLSGQVKLYRLGCNMDPEAAELAYDAMKG